MDVHTGGVAPPEEIVPGYVVAVPETGELLRLTATDYDDATETVSLQLETPRSSVEQLIAKALRKRSR